MKSFSIDFINTIQFPSPIFCMDSKSLCILMPIPSNLRYIIGNSEKINYEKINRKANQYAECGEKISEIKWKNNNERKKKHWSTNCKFYELKLWAYHTKKKSTIWTKKIIKRIRKSCVFSKKKLNIKFKKMVVCFRFKLKKMKSKI